MVTHIKDQGLYLKSHFNHLSKLSDVAPESFKTFIIYFYEKDYDFYERSEWY